MNPDDAPQPASHASPAGVGSDSLEVRLTDGLDLIASIESVIQSHQGLETIFHDLCRLVVEIMQTEVCSVYLLEEGRLVLRAAVGLNPDAVGKVAIAMGEGITGSCASSRAPVSVANAPADFRFKFFPGIGEENLVSCLSVPMFDGEKVLGVMNVQTVRARYYSDGEVKFMTFLSHQVASAVRSVHLHEGLLKGFRELSVIQQINKIISSILDLDELMQAAARSCAEYLFTRGCVVRLLNPATRELEIRGVYGVERDSLASMVSPATDGVNGEALSTGSARIRNDIDPAACPDPSGAPKQSLLCAPLNAGDRPIGTLTVFDKISDESGRPTPFSEGDSRLLSAVCGQVAMAIENARLFERTKKLADEKEMRIHQLSLVLEISNVMRDMMGLEETLYIILTALTMGQTFGFNRAALFLKDEEGDVLFGKMAVGPKNAEEAERIWKSIQVRGATVSELLMELGEFNMRSSFEIDNAIKAMKIPLEDDGVLARTVRQRKTHNVTDYFSGPASPHEAPLRDLGFSDFLAVPLVAKDRTIGLTLVDNLVTRNPIREEDVQFLRLFVNHAATAIERARIHNKLEIANRSLQETRDQLVRAKTLATLGEFSAGVAHELRNPLVSIGGFARRLVKTLAPSDPNHNYARIIASEVEHLEGILTQILDFVAGASAQKRKVDVRGLVEEVIMLFNLEIERTGVHVEVDVSKDIGPLYVDEGQMRQLFINLVKNAIQAMSKEGGTLTVKAELVEEGGNGIGFEVSDTGCGVAPEDMSRIFDPFFTRKDKGTGLGLSICSRIVEMNHQGRMFMESEPGKGASVLVWLPPACLNPPEGERGETGAP